MYGPANAISPGITNLGVEEMFSAEIKPKSFLRGSAFLCLMPCPLQLMAQSTAAAAPQPAAAATDPVGLQEIIVTAQRRAENLQDVPISVTAVTAEALRNSGVEGTRDLPQLVPAVQMSRSGPSGLFFVRGVGTTNAASGEEGANAIYVDGVYLGDLSQAINYFNNIAQIEVLKGPQGTLFGRNATGGLIQISTRDPGKDLVAKGQFGLSNYQTVDAQAYVGGPLTDKIGADIALTAHDQGKGWGRNITLNRKNQTQRYDGARSKIVFAPSDSVKFKLAGDYFNSSDNQGLGWRIADGTIGTGGYTSPGGHDTTSNTPAISKLEQWGVSLTGSADLGFANLTSISALRRSRNHSAFDVDGGPLNLVNIDYVAHGRTFQQELRLASTDTEPFSWQVGGFYLKSEATTKQNQNGLAFAAAGLRANDINAKMTTDSYAAFGELSYAITPTTKLTGGLRYTRDKRDFTGSQAPTLLTGAAGPVGAVTAALKYNELTYRAAIHQKITADISVYGSINRGFKAGAFNLQNPLTPPVQPQFIMAYEIGLKSELFDRRLRFNVAAYHYDISDYQVRSAAAANPGANILLNAATVKVDGVDVEFEAAPTEELRLFGGFTILDARFSSFGGAGAAFQAPIIYPNPATCPANLRGTADPGILTPGARTGGYTTCFGDVSGNRTALAPKFAGSIGANYTIATGETGKLRLSVLYNYNSGYYFEPDNVARQGSFGLLNASVEYRPTENVGVELFGRNITNTNYVVQDLSTGTGITEVLAPPRTYGVNLKFDF
jgi:iron complex outermembrane receptor protein